MTQIETVRKTADRHGWGTTVEHDRLCSFTKDTRRLFVWFGPKGNLSGAQMATRLPTGRFGWTGIRPPMLNAQVLSELAR